MKLGRWILWVSGALLATVLAATVGTVVAYSVWESDHIAKLVSQSQVIETARGKLEYAVVGKGMPRLMIHGTPGGYDQGLVQAIVRPESVADEQIISVSRPGYLRTPLGSGRTPAEQADLYAALLDELDIDRVIVSGASGGAPSAVQFAMRHPDRTRALLLVVPLLTDLDGTSMAEEASALQMMQTDVMTWLVANFAAPSVVPAMDPDDPVQVKSMQIAFGSTLPNRMRRPGQQNDSVEFRRLGIEDWPLESITAPTLLIHGDADENAPYEASVRAAERIPNAELATFEGGGHFIVITESTAIRERIDRFLDKLE